MPKNTKKCRKAIQKEKKTTFTPKEKISRVMEEKTFSQPKSVNNCSLFTNGYSIYRETPYKKTTVASSKRILSRQLPKVVCHEITLE